jgi:hypothetical protein
MTRLLFRGMQKAVWQKVAGAIVVRRTRLLAQAIAREFDVTVSPDGGQAQFAVNLHDQAELFQPRDIAL